MSEHAGSILHVAGRNVIDRLQSAGLGDTRLPIETIREVGNREVVDKVPGEPDFTFSLEGLNATTELEAWLTGKIGGTGSAQPPGYGDAEGTAYSWLDMVSRCVNVTSPWKNPVSGSAGTVEAGHLIPGYYVNRINYQFGVTENAQQTAELGGGSYFYGEFAPVEQYETGDNVEDTFTTDEAAIRYRRGGSAGTLFRSVFGVMVDGQTMVDGVDYASSGGAAGPGGATATIVFVDPPANGADIRFVYFSAAAHAYPQSVHANVNVSPGAVRGRNIHVYLNAGSGDVKLGGIQTATLEGTVDGNTNDRELGTEDPTGRTINGTDARGTLTVRSKDKDAFFAALSLVTGVSRTEIFGWFNEHLVELKIKIENPKAPGTYLKTLHVEQAKFQPPGTPARVNSATDFAFNYESNNGDFAAVKGDIDA